MTATAPTAGGLEALLRQAGQYLPSQELDTIRRAYEFAAEAHDGQVRASGEPYINHPLAAAVTIAELRLDVTDALDKRR